MARPDASVRTGYGHTGDEGEGYRYKVEAGRMYTPPGRRVVDEGADRSAYCQERRR